MNSNTLMPPPLRRGDCIGLFAPAGPVRDQGRVEEGIRLLHGMGFQTKLLRSPAPGHEYLAASDQERADELHTLWRDDEVRALMALRGGYGCLRLMAHLDFPLFRARPKFLIGFSDVTVLLNGISQHTGLVTIHGPVVSSLAACDPESLRSLATLLAGELHEYHLPRQVEVLRPGRASGILRGGNLATLVHLLGTPWDISWDGALLFLEDTGEPMYKIDRMLSQLFYAGRFNKLAGLLLGTFDHRESPDQFRLQEQLWHRVLELTTHADYPILGGLPVGHLAQNQPLPIGAKATVDSGGGRLLLQMTNDR